MATSQPTVEAILLRYETDRDNSEEMYVRLRRKLIRFFSNRHCHDPEGLTDETIYRVVKNVHSGIEIQNGNPYSYIFAVASHVFSEYVRKEQRERKAIEKLIPTALAFSERCECLERCLQALSPEEREIFRDYYLDKYQREEQAQELNISPNALRVQVCRIKGNLRKCFATCFKVVPQLLIVALII